MNRVARYRAGYVAVLVCGASAVLGLLWLLDWNPVAVVVLVVVLLVPGRIQGFLFRDLFRGRRELDAGHPSLALRHLAQFLTTLERQPWRRHALWLSWSVYTPSAAAMALNNLGAAHLALGAAEPAARAWREALAIDHLYPLPYANLALVAAADGDSVTAEGLLALARSLGYSGGTLDKTTRQMQTLLAALEGRGTRRQG